MFLRIFSIQCTRKNGIVFPNVAWWCAFLFSTYLGPFLESQGQIPKQLDGWSHGFLCWLWLMDVDGLAGKSQRWLMQYDAIIYSIQRNKGVLGLPKNHVFPPLPLHNSCVHRKIYDVVLITVVIWAVLPRVEVWRTFHKSHRSIGTTYCTTY